MGVALVTVIGTYDSCCVSGATQAITADTVIAYITHDDRPDMPLASNRRGAKQRGGLFS